MRFLFLVFSFFYAFMGRASAESSFDPYLALPASSPDSLNYVRKNEVQVIVDMNVGRCTLILTNGEEVTAHQTCASLIDQLPQLDRVKFSTHFGHVFVHPDFVFDLRSTNNFGCRLNFQNNRFVAVEESCSRVHTTLVDQENSASLLPLPTRPSP